MRQTYCTRNNTTFLHQKLVADLEGDTHGDFEDLLVALVTPPSSFDCHEIMRAIKVSLYVQVM